ncbi:MAG: hypothetical protein KA146_09510 [Leptospiraceae bacterium]|nr:hypothetical protein [Leptospiraceae bacterium]
MGKFFKRLYLTYIKPNQDTGQVYSGKASGLDDESLTQEELADKILNKRDSSHHKNEDGFDRAILDVVSYDADAVRGREQDLIEYYGGAQSEGGDSGNFLNGISKRNKKRNEYREASKKLFGKIMIIFLISYPIYLLFELWVKK